MSYSVNEKVRTRVTVCWSTATLSRDNRTAIQTLPLCTIISAPTPVSNDTVDFPWGNYPIWQDELIPVHHNWAFLAIHSEKKKSNICSLVLVLECPASLGYKLNAISCYCLYIHVVMTAPFQAPTSVGYMLQDAPVTSYCPASQENAEAGVWMCTRRVHSRHCFRNELLLGWTRICA